MYIYIGHTNHAECWEHYPANAIIEKDFNKLVSIAYNEIVDDASCSYLDYVTINGNSVSIENLKNDFMNILKPIENGNGSVCICVNHCSYDNIYTFKEIC